MKRILLSIMAAGVMSGCSAEPPDCSDARTTKLVTDIAMKEIKKEPRWTPAELKKIVLSLDMIRTTDINKDTGMKSCAADLVFTYESKNMNTSITYTSEMTDDEQQQVVTVYGL